MHLLKNNAPVHASPINTVVIHSARFCQHKEMGLEEACMSAPLQITEECFGDSLQPTLNVKMALYEYQIEVISSVQITINAFWICP